LEIEARRVAGPGGLVAVAGPKKRTSSKKKRTSSKKKRTSSKKKRAVSKKKTSCPRGTIYREKTGKCVKIDGAIGKKLALAKSLGVTEDQIPVNVDRYYVKSPSPVRKVVASSKSPSCISRSKTPLRDVQTKTVEYFNSHDSLLVVHGTGMGKTLTALTAAQCFLDGSDRHTVTVVTAASLVDNFKNAYKQYGDVDASRYKVYNFDRFMNMYKKSQKDNTTWGDKNTMLIVDEVHIMKNYTGEKFTAIMQYAKHAKKVLLLTATPYVNSVCDFISIVNLLYRKVVIAPARLNVKRSDPLIFHEGAKTKISGCGQSISKISLQQVQGQMNTIAHFLAGKLSYAEKPIGGEYPKYTVHKEIIPMNKVYEEMFLQAVNTNDVFDDPSAFYNGYRRAVNKLGAKDVYNDKLKFVAKVVKDSPQGNVIFSNWLEFGVEVITNFLDDKGLTYAVISGETPIADRKNYVDAYNNGLISTLVISTAGATGLDLKGTQNLFVIDPVWNIALLDQIIGRTVRYRSHVHLPRELQKVNVYLLILVEKDVIKGIKKISQSGDYLLYEIIDKKKKFTEIVEKTLRKISIV
jgi:hypothetical protein